MVFAEYSPFFLSSALAAFSVMLWTIIVPRITFIVLGASLLAGQLIRIPLLGQVGGILLSDAAVLVVLGASVVQVLRKQRHTQTLSFRLLLLTTPFLIWSFFTLILAAPGLGTHSSLVAGSYFLRLSAYLLLLPALLVLFQDQKLREFSRRVFIGAVTALIVFGYLQLIFFPQLSTIPTWLGSGWDPHEFRLVSTWLDPNFFGVFLVLSGTYIVSLFKQSLRHHIPYIVLLFVSFGALIATQSRSSIAALAGSLLIFSPFVVWSLLRSVRGFSARILVIRISVTAALLLALIVGGGIVLHERLLGLVTVDATASVRLESLQAAWELLAQKHAVVGVGYNAYQFAALEAGITSDASLHSRAGADNSILTLWITTGILGVILFFVPWTYVLTMVFQKFFRSYNPYHLIIPATAITLLFHSQFVNSLLYAHVLITLFWIWALSLSSARS